MKMNACDVVTTKKCALIILLTIGTIDMKNVVLATAALLAAVAMPAFANEAVKAKAEVVDAKTEAKEVKADAKAEAAAVKADAKVDAKAVKADAKVEAKKEAAHGAAH
ncbi:MAG: hypothetical protein V4735_01330 [Pseudomonadota bacterium]